MISYKQLSLADIFSDCKEKFENNKYQFLSLLENTIDLDELVSVSFLNHFYAYTGRPRKYQLYAMLRALILQRIFSIPTDSLLIIFLKYSQELRDFCGFSKVPDASKFTRFKQDFLLDLQSMFDHLVDITEPICQQIDASLASMTIFDTSGIEAFVTENNPKYANRIIKQLKAFKKINGLGDSYDPYKAAYGSMPSHSKSNPAIQQMYINGHFCYSYKFGIITNGLGIVRDISFYNQEFLKSHLRSGIPSIKHVCPKMKWVYNKETKKSKRVTLCENPCTNSSCGRMFYIYPEKNLRAYPGTTRGTQEWEDTYKIRSAVEKNINHFKNSYCIADRKTQNEKTLHADLLLAGITQLITVVVADKIHKHKYIRSLRPLIA